MFNYKPVSHELSASRAYRLKTRAKRPLRNLRRSLLESLETHRNVAVLHRWNLEHQERLIAYFERLKEMPTRLSGDRERSTVLDRMTEAFHGFLRSTGS
jgi:hypothetical protein